ncbi:MAG: hypothetical protein OXI70_12175 [Chloroflexota bacterium]|nr:hypothetical protein [Chloroflexota bacterium]
MPKRSAKVVPPNTATPEELARALLQPVSPTENMPWVKAQTAPSKKKKPKSD